MQKKQKIPEQDFPQNLETSFGVHFAPSDL